MVIESGGVGLRVSPHPLVLGNAVQSGLPGGRRDRGLPDMTSAKKGEGVHGKADVAREVA